MTVYDKKGSGDKIHDDDESCCNNSGGRDGGGTMKLTEDMTS